MTHEGLHHVSCVCRRVCGVGGMKLVAISFCFVAWKNSLKEKKKTTTFFYLGRNWMKETKVKQFFFFFFLDYNQWLLWSALTIFQIIRYSYTVNCCCHFISGRSRAVHLLCSVNGTVQYLQYHWTCHYLFAVRCLIVLLFSFSLDRLLPGLPSLRW